MMFNELRIGAIFDFDHTDTRFIDCCKQGPWIKISARKYEHTKDGMKCKIGSVNTKIIGLN